MTTQRNLKGLPGMGEDTPGRTDVAEEPLRRAGFILLEKYAGRPGQSGPQAWATGTLAGRTTTAPSVPGPHCQHTKNARP